MKLCIIFSRRPSGRLVIRQRRYADANGGRWTFRQVVAATEDQLNSPLLSFLLFRTILNQYSTWGSAIPVQLYSNFDNFILNLEKWSWGNKVLLFTVIYWFQQVFNLELKSIVAPLWRWLDNFNAKSYLFVANTRILLVVNFVLALFAALYV